METIGLVPNARDASTEPRCLLPDRKTTERGQKRRNHSTYLLLHYGNAAKKTQIMDTVYNDYM